MKILYATDLHGKRDAIEKLFDTADSESIKTVIIGGDVTPKKMAIRLPENRHGKKRSGGEIIPLEMLRESPPTLTFLESMEIIRKWNEKLGSSAVAAQIESDGGIIYDETNRFYDFGDMSMEQLLLEKLYNFFGDESSTATFTKNEIEMVEDFAVECMREYEKQWPTEKRNALKDKFVKTFSTPVREFWEICPSRYLLNCVLMHALSVKMGNAIRQAQACITKPKNLAEQYLRRSIECACRSFLNASMYKNFIQPSDISMLVRFSSIPNLISRANQNFEPGQRKFLEEYLMPRVQQWKAADSERIVALMFGNDDIMTNEDILVRAESEGAILNLNGFTKSCNNLSISGYGFVESLPDHVQYREWVKGGEEILDDLNSLSKGVEPNSSIWVIHTPPNGYLDCIGEDIHVGSEAVLNFIKNFQPRIALFGHIHEVGKHCPSSVEKIGDTTCINPGALHKGKVDAAIIDTETMEVKII